MTSQHVVTVGTANRLECFPRAEAADVVVYVGRQFMPGIVGRAQHLPDKVERWFQVAEGGHGCRIGT